MRRLNVCVRGLPEERSTSGEDSLELLERVHCVLRELTGRDVDIVECYRVGRVTPSRPRPVIVSFIELCDKLLVLRAKRVLYSQDCPASLRSIRIYHDLSPGQMDWKFRLRPAYEYFLSRDIRVIWRNGYRLFAFLEGAWTEFFPQACLIT